MTPATHSSSRRRARAIILGFHLILGVCLLSAAEWRETEKFPPRAPEQIEPLEGIGPATISPITAKQARDTLQYGRLWMLRGIESKQGSAADDAVMKDLGVSVVSHSGFHRGALPWNNRPKTLADMISVSASNRVHIAETHKLGILVLAYADYQRWFVESHHQEWKEQRATWKKLLGDAPEDDAAFLMKLKDGAIAGPKGGLHSMGDSGMKKSTRVILCLNAPTTLARAKATVSIDAANGCDGNYFDCGGFSANTCSCDYCRKAWAEWLSARFSVEKRKELFGESEVAKIPLPDKNPRDGSGGRAWDPKRPRLRPVEVAFGLFQVEATAWFRREIKAWGRSLNPNWIMTSTCWSHDGHPGWYNSQFEHYLGERGDDFVFWEPGTRGPNLGNTEESASQAALAAPAKNPNAKDQPLDYRWGRRTFSPALRYLQAMATAAKVPAVSKMSPPKSNNDPLLAERLTDLLLAETSAELCSSRVGYRGEYSPEAVKRMFRFQAANPEFFVGARPASSVAVHVSGRQGLINRRDAASSFLRFLDDLGLDARAVLDGDLTPEGLRPFACVVLPASDMLDDQQLVALEEYRKTGRLVVFGPSGTRDEWDRERPDGLRRLVGDLARGAEGKETMISPDGHVAFLPVGVSENFPENMWYRRARDMNMAELRRAIEGTLGKAWPFLAEPSQTRLIHLAAIEKPGGAGVRLTAHVVNYETTKDMAAFPLEIRLNDGFRATAASSIQLDRPEEKTPLDVEQVTREGHPYAKLTVPATRVYRVVAVDCVQ
ncbi:MAG: hypothetical protein HUU04_03690 [Verrucomicrobiae bacterium]|nr:hypothetical protein [Verrucomicrobiae bacterium]